MVIHVEAMDGRVFELKFTYSPGSPGTYWDPPESPEIDWDGYAVEMLPRGIHGSHQVLDIEDFCVQADTTLEALEDKAIEVAGDMDFDEPDLD